MTKPITFNTPVPSPLQAPSPIKGDDRVAELMQEIIQQKSDLVHSSETKRLNAGEAILIGGDLFSMGYLLFQGAQIVNPGLSAIPAVAVTSLACGVIAGAINIGVAFICLKEGLQAHKNGDMKLAARLYIDFIALLGIGIIMMLTSLALRVGAFAGLSALFAAHPWLLPVLFLGISLPILLEVGGRIRNIWNRVDLGSELKNPQDVSKLIQGTDTTNPFHLKPLIESTEDNSVVKKALSDRMEILQANIGVEAAIETFKLMQTALRKEDTKAQFEITQKKITEWNRAQYVRLFQQVLYTAAFVVSMASLSPVVNTKGVQAGQTFAMAGANAIPLYMDSFWPFKRNTLIVVPKVDPSS